MVILKMIIVKFDVYYVYYKAYRNNYTINKNEKPSEKNICSNQMFRII